MRVTWKQLYPELSFYVTTNAFLLGFKFLMFFCFVSWISVVTAPPALFLRNRLFIHGALRMTNIVTAYFYTDTARTPNDVHKSDALKLSVSRAVGCSCAKVAVERVIPTL